ncbi:MAG: anthranilate synthase component I, partial [Thermoplasmata archaeon]
LRSFLRDRRKSLHNPLPFQGGIVGHLSYDAVTHLEPVPLPKGGLADVPQMAFLEVNDLVIFDHTKGAIIPVSHQGKRFAEEVLGVLQDPPREITLEDPPPGPPRSTFTEEGFLEAVKRTRELILAGEAIQVVLAQIFTIPSPRDPLSVYRRLRRINPSPYMFYLHFGDTKLIGASPEVLVRLTGRSIDLRPIAGTRPRGVTAKEDEALERELLTDPKERAEHIMLVDLGRNDVGRVAIPGSVEVSGFMEVERYSHVMHIVSHIQGKLKTGLNSFDLFMSAFPAGTVTGAPKLRAMQIINELEPCSRGPYAGAVGYFGFNGNMDFCITIRTITISKDTLSIQVGAGIVHDSLPEKEYEETLKKAAGMFKAIERAQER